MNKVKLNREQAQDVSVACEFYARIIMGQFNEISWHTLDIKKLDSSDFCERRDNAENYLFKARSYIYPELYGAGHSYGIGHFREADISFDIHQVLRNYFGVERKPFSYNKLPEVEVNGDEFTLMFNDEQLTIAANACRFFHRICNGYFEDIVALCNGKDNPPALDWLNLAKKELITEHTNPATDMLEVYELIKDLMEG